MILYLSKAEVTNSLEGGRRKDCEVPSRLYKEGSHTTATISASNCDSSISSGCDGQRSGIDQLVS